MCDVEEPISTPTVVSSSSSSSTRLRLALLKNIRPPTVVPALLVANASIPANPLRVFGWHVAVRFHAVFAAILPYGFSKLFTQIWIFHPIWNGCTALLQL